VGDRKLFVGFTRKGGTWRQIGKGGKKSGGGKARVGGEGVEFKHVPSLEGVLRSMLHWELSLEEKESQRGRGNVPIFKSRARALGDTVLRKGGEMYWGGAGGIKKEKENRNHKEGCRGVAGESQKGGGSTIKERKMQVRGNDP